MLLVVICFVDGVAVCHVLMLLLRHVLSHFHPTTRQEILRVSALFIFDTAIHVAEYSMVWGRLAEGRSFKYNRVHHGLETLG